MTTRPRQSASLRARIGPHCGPMMSSGQFHGQIHASCAARPGAETLAPAALLLGPPGAGKSDLLLRLLDRGFRLVADDCVEIDGDIARPPAALAGLLEVRGLGILRLDHLPEARLALAVELGPVPPGSAGRLPEPSRHPALGLPLVRIDPAAASAAARVAIALDCATGRTAQLAGAFA